MKFRKTAAALAAAMMMLTAMPAAAKQTEPVKVTSANNIKGTQRVTIGQFTIAFLIERKDSTKAGGGLMGSGFGGRSTVRSTLEAYTQADLQAITDAAYTDFVAQLTAAGFEVVDRAQLAATPSLVAQRGEPGPKEMSTVTGRDDSAKVLLVGATQTQPLRVLVGDVQGGGFGGIGSMMAGMKVAGTFAEYAKATDTRVINVIYYLNFAKSDEYGGWFRSSSAVNVSGSLAMMQDYSHLSLIAPNYKTASLALAQPVAVGGDFFRKQDTQSGAEKTGNAIGNVIGLLGGVGTNSSRKFSFTPEPGRYQEGARQLATEANTVLVQKLAALR